MWVEISYIYRNQMSQVSCVVLGQTCHKLNTHSNVGYIVGEWIQRENQYLLRRSLCVISHQHDSLNSSIATSHYLSRRMSSSSVSSVDEHIFSCKYLFWYYSSAERESAGNWVRNNRDPRELTLLNSQLITKNVVYLIKRTILQSDKGLSQHAQFDLIIFRSFRWELKN